MSFTIPGTGPVSLASGSSVVVDPATGDRSSLIATMKKFADEFGVLLTTNGYQKLPSGLIIQWGSVTTDGTSSKAGTFPIAFPNQCLDFHATLYATLWPSNYSVGGYASSATAFFTTACLASNASAVSGVTIRWFAIGY